MVWPCSILGLAVCMVSQFAWGPEYVQSERTKPFHIWCRDSEGSRLTWEWRYVCKHVGMKSEIGWSSVYPCDLSPRASTVLGRNRAYFLGMCGGIHVSQGFTRTLVSTERYRRAISKAFGRSHIASALHSPIQVVPKENVQGDF
jgi:hypothetical protein